MLLTFFLLLLLWQFTTPYANHLLKKIEHQLQNETLPIAKLEKSAKIIQVGIEADAFSNKTKATTILHCIHSQIETYYKTEIKRHTSLKKFHKETQAQELPFL
jgi:hypothetical protein